MHLRCNKDNVGRIAKALLRAAVAHLETTWTVAWANRTGVVRAEECFARGGGRTVEKVTSEKPKVARIVRNLATTYHNLATSTTTLKRMWVRQNAFAASESICKATLYRVAGDPSNEWRLATSYRISVRSLTPAWTGARTRARPPRGDQH